MRKNSTDLITKFKSLFQTFEGKAFPWWFNAREVPHQARPGFTKKGYRFPAPGSPASPPILPADTDRAYDANHFPIDTRRRADTTPYFSTSANIKKLQTNSIPDAELPNYQGSPGRPNTDVSRYDPTGLRSSMTATWAALETKLDENMPDHLPLPHWYRHQDKIVKKFQSRGLPPVCGEEWKAIKESDMLGSNNTRFSNKW